MDPKLVPLSATLSRTKQWSSRILIADKSSHRKIKNTVHEYERYTFVGCDVHCLYVPFILAMSWNLLTPYWHCLLVGVQGISYMPDTPRCWPSLATISNIKITNCTSEFQLVDRPRQLIMTASTVMEIDMDHPLDVALARPQLAQFLELDKFLGTGSNLGIFLA